VPTDYACQAAAEQAAHGIAPVRALLAPSNRSAPQQQEEVSVVIRSFLGSDAPGRPPANDDVYVEPVAAPVGAAVLLSFLDGLRADLSGALNVTQEQVASAVTDETTVLPEGLSPSPSSPAPSDSLPVPPTASDPATPTGVP